MSGPSDKAVEAGIRGVVAQYGQADVPTVRGCLDAAYPIIRADVIAEVVEMLEREENGWQDPDNPFWYVAQHLKQWAKENS